MRKIKQINERMNEIWMNYLAAPNLFRQKLIPSTHETNLFFLETPRLYSTNEFCSTVSAVFSAADVGLSPDTLGIRAVT